jgi:hypothetical protein
MRNWARSFPNWARPDDAIVQAHAERNAEMHIGYAAGLKELKERLSALTVSILKGGSGFPMAGVLRDYFGEYFFRFSNFGMEAMPTSFNVVEAFLRISNPLYDFVPREEHEHLLRLYEYFNWFTTSGQTTNDPSVLQQVMTEGEIYSYEMTGSQEDFRLGTENSETAIIGISLVRHKHELSVILLAGEKPPYPSDEEIRDEVFEGVPATGKECIVPNPDLQVADRMLSSLPGYCRVIVLTRIDLTARSYDVRYVNIDVGKSFIVHTDDPCVSRDLNREQRENNEVHLKRYTDLFSAVVALIYLPVFFIIRQADVVEERFTTDLGIQQSDTTVRKAIKILGRSNVALERSVHCLRCDIPPSESSGYVIKSSEFNSTLRGHWKELTSTEIGVDADGNPVVGKTWVSTYESWSTWHPEDFVIKKKEHNIVGADPGTIYVMRSEAHTSQLFKIGLNRRDAETRATELNAATGMPVPLSVLLDWEVADCATVEKMLHKRLARYRINKRREFFRAPISTIIRTIEDVIALVGQV